MGGSQEEKMVASHLDTCMLFFDCSWKYKSEPCRTLSGVHYPREQAPTGFWESCLPVDGFPYAPAGFPARPPFPHSKLLHHPAGYHTCSLTGLAPWWWWQSAREALLDVSLLAQNPPCSDCSRLPRNSVCPWQAIPTYVVNHTCIELCLSKFVVVSISCLDPD